MDSHSATLWQGLHGRASLSAAGSFGSQHTPRDMWLLQRLKELQAESAAGKDVKLRVEVEGGGCSGFQYKFRLDDRAVADDDV